MAAQDRRRGNDGGPPPKEGLARGVRLLHDPIRNKGTAFTEAERDALGLRGLLPPRVQTQNQQVQRVLANLRSKSDDLERYIFLVALQDRNETLFYRVLNEHLEEMMPLIYTPTVGQACQTFGHIFRRPRGLFVCAHDRGRVHELVANWPHDDVRIVVVTDGERILGLGDLGAAGMGIPIGKLALYTACGGIPPTRCLPVTLDVGTENEEMLLDPLYIGIQHRRLRGVAYDALVDEFLDAVLERFPQAIIQFEDFATANAFRLLQTQRERICCFNDDIQGTAAVALAGLLSALRTTGATLETSRLLFLGAGEAAIGIGELTVSAMRASGVDEDTARRCCWFVDSKGLVIHARKDLAPHKRPFAHDHDAIPDLLGAVRALRPTALIGASGAPRTFTREVIEATAEHNDRPIVFALSNPTSMSECTAEEAYTWSDGRALFASGSPFPPFEHNGRMLIPGQGNNAYIFPGLGLGAIHAQASRITDAMFLEAARTLATSVGEEELAAGRLYPALGRIREVSALIAEAVAAVAYDTGLAQRDRPDDLLAAIKSEMYRPNYQPLA
jgi:malate dehydrogenase (oxaloacetate-decarboxylating)(NADP+)